MVLRSPGSMVAASGAASVMACNRRTAWWAIARSIWMAFSALPAGVARTRPPVTQERVVYVHIPKTSGTSVIASLALARANFCFVDTTGLTVEVKRRHFGMRTCRIASVVIMERAWAARPIPPGLPAFPSSYLKPAERVLALALVREPASWLSSTVMQLCCATPDCTKLKPRATGAVAPCAPVRALLSGNATPSDALTFQRGLDAWLGSSVKYYYRNPSIQSQMLGGVIDRAPNYLVCAMDQRARVLAALSAVTGRHVVDVHKRANSHAFGTAQGHLPLTAAHLSTLQADMALWARLRSASTGCVYNLTSARYSHALAPVLGMPAASRRDQSQSLR